MANIVGVIKELEQERDRLNKAITALTPLAGRSNTSSARATGGQRRTLSAAARRRISLAQKARWAKTHSLNSGKGQPTAQNSNKRVLSITARRRIAAAQRARWAKQKQQQKKAA